LHQFYLFFIDQLNLHVFLLFDFIIAIPVAPWQRQTLNSLLTQMVEQRGGNLIYDVQLERFFDDEADQGYYEDNEISPEETAELNRRRLK